MQQKYFPLNKLGQALVRALLEGRQSATCPITGLEVKLKYLPSAETVWGPGKQYMGHLKWLGYTYVLVQDKLSLRKSILVHGLEKQILGTCYTDKGLSVT